LVSARRLRNYWRGAATVSVHHGFSGSGRRGFVAHLPGAGWQAQPPAWAVHRRSRLLRPLLWKPLRTNTYRNLTPV